MIGSLEGRVALVTGASSGIGRATALMLAAHGARVALFARRRSSLEEVASAIGRKGGTSLVLAGDIADASDAARAVDETTTAWGRLDICVNSAGVFVPRPVLEGRLEDWDRMLNVNARGLLHVASAALPPLRAAAAETDRGFADLVCISSTSGRRAYAGSAVYNMTKFAVNGFVESLRGEVASEAVRVSLVSPGSVDTEMHRDPERSPDPAFAGYDYLQPEEVADAVLYLVTRPRNVWINELTITPISQTW